MVKPEWGTKRTCPKCGERFYDLGNEDPVTCIECGNEWTPEPVLKSKQPIPFDEQDKKKKDDDKEADSDLADDDLEDIDEDDDSPDNDVDLGGDDDLGVDTGDTGKEDDEN
ncbi:TIGR02300 family protein [Aurantiacibacter sediminis]|uniref:TIGR02300 family protein n=1 Tax=Aurantiacibacter sediminis TaxID=2793064 RepID=A0ABS0N3P6_9SPHN|nr:TIGR02300 family protein [Aurantiacibacter sediminis]MBH5322347.1 TIGR02300 family protein [Aurantiacibacter sediminis]